MRRRGLRRLMTALVLAAVGGVGFGWCPRVQTPLGAVGLLPAGVQLLVWPPSQGPAGFNVTTVNPGVGYDKNRWRSVHWFGRAERFGGSIYSVEFPLGPAAGLLVVWAGFDSFVLHRRRKTGRCRACGYDLRGLGPGVPCPECGVLPVPVGATAG